MEKNNDNVRQALFDKAEGLGWSVSASEDCVEFYKYSPAGEDFGFPINGESSIPSEVREYAQNFDTEEHVKMWIEGADHGVGGVPDIKTLAQDADDIKAMLAELADALEQVENPDKKHDEQKKIMAVLHEHPLDDGYSMNEIQTILFYELKRAGIDDDEELLPVMLDGEHGTVFGFIRYEAAEDLLSFRIDQNSEYGSAVIAVLDDMEKETEDGIYEFCGVVTKIFR